jgi:phospholipid/cholesterol/gamma-HCH transport system permease protein
VRGRFRAGIVTSGALVMLGVGAASFAVTDIVRRRFSWSEFLLQAWFMTRVSLLPTILVAIPFGVIT